MTSTSSAAPSAPSDADPSASASSDTTPSRSSRPSVLVRTGGVVAAMAAVGLVAGACSSDDSDAGTTTPPETSTAAADDAGGDQYKNGEYTAEGGYLSPGGPQKVGVTVTLSNDIITAVSVDTSQTKGPSLEYQGKFAGGISDVVVGKNIDEIDVDKVSGSSLTSGGFNEAIETIKQEAAN